MQETRALPEDPVRSRTSPLATMFLRQFRLPSFARGLAETLVLYAVFVATAIVTVEASLPRILIDGVPVVLVMMLCTVACGVYRSEITNSIMNIYVHSLYGFVLGAAALLAIVFAFTPEFATPKFVGFFLFLAFFVINTVRPLVSGTPLGERGRDQVETSSGTARRERSADA